MAVATWRNKWLLAAVAAVAVLLLVWIVGHVRGPVLPGYEVVQAPLVQTVVATGRVTTLSRVQVGTEISGLVLERRVMEGDRVAPGDVLVVLRASDLEARRDEARAALAALTEEERPDAQARRRQAQAELAQAERDLARRRELGERQLVSRESVEQAAQAVVAARAAAEQARLAVAALSGGAREAQARDRLAAAEADLARAVIRSTVAGTVLIRNVEPGDTVGPGDMLLEIASDAPNEVVVALDEKNLDRLQVGQQATCIADAFPGRPFAATVHQIAPGVDPARGTIEVRLRIDPAADFVRQDMTVTATILTGRSDSALAVANDALLDAGPGAEQGDVLLVRDGRVQRATVRLGLRGLAMSQVVGGLEPGDRVLAAGALAPDRMPADGERVRVRLQAAPDTADATAGELPVQFD
jgi:HlyD family secretion protein